MISDDEAEKSVNYLRDNALKAAQAKANRIYMEEYARVVKSQIMREYEGLTVSAQEREAYSDSRYQQHLKAIQEAVEKDEYHRWMMIAAQAKLEAWRSQSANERASRV